MIIAVDFDGTCVTHEFPEIGSDIGAAPVLKELTEAGHQLILFTMRSNNGTLPLFTAEGVKETSGNFLDDAVNWFKENDIPLYGIQTNPTQSGWTTSPKAYAQLYIDDAAFGCPLVTPPFDPDGRSFVDWIAVRKGLVSRGLIK